MGRTLPTVSNDYVVGLTDGEGCFYVNVGKSSRYRSGYRIQLHFHLKMQGRDRALLEKVRNTIGCGEVYFQKELRANHCQCYRYTVSAERDIQEIVIPFFKRHPLQSASKSASFEVFCEIAALVKEGQHLNAEGIEKIRKLKSCMNQKTVGLA
ncbi:MAG: LAGLIDADG family homing endonuclease [Candidatus Pacebacteria bacterium]|nr:LAGLIDADG family homing endonuclease [Candidatus Paceibacterota bacterium]